MVSTIQQRESAISRLLLESPFLSPPHPTHLACHRALDWALWLHSNFPLAISFTHGNIYVSILLSQFVPPSPSHTVSTSLFSMSASLSAEEFWNTSKTGVIVACLLSMVPRCLIFPTFLTFPVLTSCYERAENQCIDSFTSLSPTLWSYVFIIFLH